MGSLSLLMWSDTALAAEGRWDEPFTQESRFIPSSMRTHHSCNGAERHLPKPSGGLQVGCLYGRHDTFRVGVLLLDDKYTYHIARPYESYYTPVEVCKGVSGCTYSHQHDTLIEVSVSGVQLYRNYSKTFKSPVGEYVYRKTGGNVPTSVGLSQNGRYVGIFMPGHGYGVLDLASRRVKQVLNRNETPDQRHIIAVSSDGKTLMVGKGKRVLIINSHYCGVYLESPSPTPLNASYDNCEISYAAEEFVTPNLSGLNNIAFSHNDARVRFDGYYKRDNGHSFLAIILKSGQPRGSEEKYLALGDSFTSGEGESDGYMYAHLTNRKHEKCHLSIRSYPYLLGDYWGVGSKSVACSGAVVKDILGSPNYKGQGNRLGSSGYDLSEAMIDVRKHEAFILYVPGRIPQKDFIGRYDPSLVTIGIGGNDAGLMNKLSSCIAPGTCEWATPAGRSKTAKELQRTYYTYTDLFHDLSNGYPNTKLVAVGYPMPVLGGGGCSAKVDILLNSIERDYLVATIKYLNTIMRAAAAKFNIPYINIEDAYNGHRICESASHPAMNYIRFGNDIAPFWGINIIGAESFHPTPFGHRLMFNKIASQLRFTDGSLTGCMYCDRTADQIPDPPSELGPVQNNTPVSVLNNDISKDRIAPGSKTAITIPEGMFLKGSTVKVVMKSDPVTLANDVMEGSTIEVTIPSGAEGLHTILIEGENEAGEGLEFYKTILIAEEELEDGTYPVQDVDNNAPSTDGKPSIDPTFSVRPKKQGRSEYASTNTSNGAGRRLSQQEDAIPPSSRTNQHESPVSASESTVLGDSSVSGEQNEDAMYLALWLSIPVLFGVLYCSYRYLSR